MRNSNIELLRIVAMFLVLVVHADYFSLGAPTAEECINNGVASLFRIGVESISIVCVNVFVLISGWFGIHFKWKSLLSFMFQVFFFGCLIYAFCVVFLGTSISLKGVAECFQVTQWNWFVKAYILLYLISPVLNEFCKNADRKSFITLLCCFFAFQTIYGCSGAAKFIEAGYSTISFIGLYLLAQFLHRYIAPSLVKIQKITLITGGGYILFVGLMTMIEYIVRRYSLPGVNLNYTYINPLVIIASCCLFLTFSLKAALINNRINWISSSAFAVFLLHTNINLCRPYFCEFVRKIYDLTTGPQCIVAVFVFLVLVFVLAVVLDQFRKKVYDGVLLVFKKCRINWVVSRFFRKNSLFQRRF